MRSGNDYRGRPSAAQKEAQAEAGADGDTPAASKTALTKTAQKILKSQKHPPCPVLFMGNLGFETKEDTIKQMLEGHHAATHASKKGGVKADEDEESDVEMKDAGEKKDIPELGLRKVRLGTFEDTGVCKG